MHDGETIKSVIKVIHFDENLFWSYHVNNVIQSFYATLKSPCQFKHFAI